MSVVRKLALAGALAFGAAALVVAPLGDTWGTSAPTGAASAQAAAR
ncbi:hypothetical protein [Streptomyces marincola]|nr:hypothetical protein [Streptomyces marincola]UCM88639.1 hypothetical protein LC193_12110 [Streptomyces marincola]